MTTGAQLLALAETRIGEKYVNVQVPKDNPNWHGPWDCAEFASWLVYQKAGKLYGCVDNADDPALAEAYSGAWVRDATNGTLTPSTQREANGTPGAFLIRKPPAPGRMGHIAISDGRGGTVEAAGINLGVRRDKVEGRLWNYVIKIPELTYSSTGYVVVPTPLPYLLTLERPNIRSSLVRAVQRALRDRGFNPGKIDGEYGPHTVAAVGAFQAMNKLVADGICGPRTAKKLGVEWPAQVSRGPIRDRAHRRHRLSETGPAMAKLRFTKMHGLGNDFVVLDGIRQTVDLTPGQLRRLADRRLGVGCDQILVVEKPTRDDVDFRYRIFNADGGEVEQCGNGARCFVKFVRDQGHTEAQRLRVETAGGIIAPEIVAGDEVIVDMGVPQFTPPDIPFVADADALVHSLDVDGEKVEIGVVSMGNPHAVQVVADVERAPVTTQGPKLEHHPRFPQRVNAGYMQLVDRATIRLRVWERGAGETQACGTGACAAVVSGIRRGLLDTSVRVETRGGWLTISWPGPGAPVAMKGPATTAFEGQWEIPPA